MAELEDACDADRILVRADTHLRLREIERVPRAHTVAGEREAVPARPDERERDAEPSQQGWRRGAGRDDCPVGGKIIRSRSDSHPAVHRLDACDVDPFAQLDAAALQVAREAGDEAFGAHVTVDNRVHPADDPAYCEGGLSLLRFAGVERSRLP